MSGMALFEWISERKASLVDRVVFMTGGVFTEEAEQLLQNCSNPVLAKPFNRDEILEILGEMIAARAR
jgi:CheY-like chemotaxis protein